MPAKIMKVCEARDYLLKDRWPKKRGLDAELLSYVEEIIRDVKERGDRALIDLTEKFDGVKLSVDRLRVSREEIERAYSMVSEKQASALEDAKKRIYEVEKAFLSRIGFEYTDELGIKICWRPKPLESVGCYVPGGKFPYPSTLLMTVIPAKVAGISRVIVCTPPSKNGEIHPITLVAADICGVNEIYRVGGAQAIAAMAYGTESIKPVEKIVGPGNQYVMAAKLLVSKDVPIDHPAGPSEIMILADETANPYYVALDLVSQVEHGPGSIAVLVTTSMRLIKKVYDSIKCLISDGDGDILLLIADDIDEAVGFANDFAPEHLEIIAEDAGGLSMRICSAGLMLIGGYSPVSISDYCLGTNHVIPTRGYSHVYQPLSVLNFIKFTVTAECPPQALRDLSAIAITLAESEGLVKHALAIGERVKG
ncbi:histidinol dehydrogenase [Candidatus Bathyarchaeota archaeon]|nr:histidinol dehydrogenase [Candidatus Bathyarchaeota archaeon]